MIKNIVIIVFLAAIPGMTGIAGAVDPPGVDSEYIRLNYPEVYRQIYLEGKEAGKKEAGELKKAASAAPVSGQPAKAAEEQAGRDLTGWWEKSSLKYSPLPEQWLFHLEGTFEYKHKTGNTKSDLYNGSVSMMARKLRVTNTISYIINKEFTEQQPNPDGSVKQTDSDYRSLQESLRYDLTDRLYTEGGYMREQDKANYISDRNILYAGAGYALVDAARFHLDLFVAGGYQNEKFPETIRDSLNMDREEVSAGYFREDFRWNITDRLTYKQTFRIIQNFSRSEVFNDDPSDLHVTGLTKRYRWFLINELYYKLTDHLNFMAGYKMEYDSNPWPTVLKRDTTLKSGIQFSF